MKPYLQSLTSDFDVGCEKSMLFQGWIIFFNNVPRLLHYFISLLALSKALDSFPELNEIHFLSVLQLPNKFNSHVRVFLVRTVSL